MRTPIATEGSVEYYPYTLKQGMTPLCGLIKSIVIEQDTAKTVLGSDQSTKLIDMNRCGIGLIEIVTHPSFFSSEQVCGFILELMSILVSSGCSHARLEDGELRVDVNVSVDREGPTGKRVEIKNLNSLLSIRRAIDYEEKRQTQILKDGSELVSETRAYDSINRRTVFVRLKDDGYDYRFIPETCLPPLQLTEADLSSIPSIRSNQEIRSYLTKNGQLSLVQSVELTRNPYMLSFFMKILALFDIPGPYLFHLLFRSSSLDVSILPRDFGALGRLALFIGPLSVLLHKKHITRHVFILACGEVDSFAADTPEEATLFVDRLVDSRNWRTLREEVIEDSIAETLRDIGIDQPPLNLKSKAEVNKLVDKVLNRLNYRVTGQRVSQFINKLKI